MNRFNIIIISIFLFTCRGRNSSTSQFNSCHRKNHANSIITPYSTNNIVVSLEKYKFVHNYSRQISPRFNIYNLSTSTNRLHPTFHSQDNRILPIFCKECNSLAYLTYHMNSEGIDMLKLCIYNVKLHSLRAIEMPHKILYSFRNSLYIDGSDIAISWSPNGKYIALFIKMKNELYIINSTSHILSNVFKHVSNYKWAPNSQEMLIFPPDISKKLEILTLSSMTIKYIPFLNNIYKGCFLTNNNIFLSILVRNKTTHSLTFGTFRIYNLLTKDIITYKFPGYPKPMRLILDPELAHYDFAMNGFDTIELYHIHKYRNTCIIQFIHYMSDGTHPSCFLWDIKKHKITSLGDAQYYGENSANCILLGADRWYGIYKRPGGNQLDTLWSENLINFHVIKFHSPYMVIFGCSWY